MKFQVTEKHNIPLEKSWKGLFNDNFFGKSDWNYYHQKPKNPKNNLGTWYVNEKTLGIVGCYRSLERS